MHYDDVFRYIGQFGRYQKFLYTLICVPQMFSAIQTLLSVFILHIPKHRCQHDSIMTSQNVYSYETNVESYKDLQFNTTVPLKCEIIQVLKNTSGITDMVWNATQSYRCSQWDYDKTYFELTYAMQNNLVCERKGDTTFAMMLFMAGFTAGSLLTGILSDA